MSHDWRNPTAWKRSIWHGWIRQRLIVNSYMLDTTVFNDIVSRGIELDRLPAGCKLIATDVQWNQITRTRDPERLAVLVGIFTELDLTLLPSSTPAWDSGPPSAGGLYEPLFDRLSELDKKTGKSQRGTREDILIAETAMLRRLVLVTDDHNLAVLVREAGGRAINLAELLASPPA